MKPPIPLATVRAMLAKDAPNVSVKWCPPDETNGEWHYFLAPDLKCGAYVADPDSAIDGVMVDGDEHCTIEGLRGAAVFVSVMPWGEEQ